MKCRIIEDKGRDEEVLIYVKKPSERAERIKAFAESEYTELVGYMDEEIVKLSPEDVYCFTIIGSKLYAITQKQKLLIKLRLYQIEELVDEQFIKINQSSLANIKKIEKFDASISGSLVVKFKNGYKDYVSRRQVKFVKERIGIK